MPPNKACPCCKGLVPDWHFEWYTQDDQKAVFGGRLAMECPFCHAGVLYDLFDLFPAPTGVVIAKRDVTKAAYWANCNDGMSLKLYLETERGRPYAHQWNDAAVESADHNAINYPEGV